MSIIAENYELCISTDNAIDRGLGQTHSPMKMQSLHIVLNTNRLVSVIFFKRKVRRKWQILVWYLPFSSCLNLLDKEQENTVLEILFYIPV